MRVAIIKDEEIDYCREPPYHPQELYPECPFNDVSANNQCYGYVRELLRMLGLDKENYGKDNWNPLGEIIKPGMSVFIKPNFVRHYNHAGGVDCMITHGSIIRAILDYVYIALKGVGHITIGDSSYLDADFEKIVRHTGIDKVADYYDENSKMHIDLIDLRQYRGRVRLIGGVDRRPLPGDPLGYSIVDLGKDSDHYEIIHDYPKFRNGYYDRNEMIKHHNMEKNEYCIANSILNADVIVNVPKLKTHSKAGMTCALKNLIGANGLKDWLPHHRYGPAECGGDDYIHRDFRKDWLARLRDEQVVTDNLLYIMPLRAMAALLHYSNKLVPFKDKYDAGGWYGNDTISRTISDLNKIIYYADRHGKMQNARQRKEFLVVDGVIAGQGEGPLMPVPKRAGVLVAGSNPVAVDLVCSSIMGFDYRKMPVFRHVMRSKKYPLFEGAPEDIEIVSDKCSRLEDVYGSYNCSFLPPDGWAGHVEYGRAPIPEIKALNR
ncbi:DUF362 domain-containing protein [Methanocella conradii]|uniref:DUF362 domain-containing protein n=1 Tax=Methanocella conradii TaxID=1175444 RepID=UPI00157CBAEF|nr:DUF362 domain-containing protein [Methanocella conradii]